MSEPYDLRLIAHTPFTTNGRKGPLPAPLQFTYTFARHGVPVLTIDYADRTTRSGWLEGPLEVSLEVKDLDGDWREPDNCRFLRTKVEWNRVDQTKVRRYTCLGLGYLLTRLKVWDADATDPGDGPQPALRIWNTVDAGHMMVPLWNAAIARAYEDLAVPLTSPPHKTFELAEDTNAVPWAEEIEGRITRRIQEPLSNLVDLLVQTGVAEPSWHLRDFNLYNFGTYGTDRTGAGAADAVILRDVHGVTASPEVKDYQDIAARILVVGDEGQTYIREDLTNDLSYGALEHSTGISGLIDADALHKAARELARLGESELEQLSREGHSGTAGPKPLRDYHVSDEIRVQRDAVAGSRFPSLDVVEIGVTRRQSKGITWHVKLGDRHEDRLLRVIRRNALLAAGEITSPGGSPSDPGFDARVPAAPTGVGVTITTEADANNKTRGIQVIEWDEVFFAASPPAETATEPINLRGYDIGEKRVGVYARIAQVGANELSWTRFDVTVGARDLAVRAVSKNGFASAWSTDADGTVARDPEPQEGLNKVVDVRYVNPDIRQKRADNAGAGFAFNTAGSRMRAQFTTDTPILRARVAGTSDGGWVPVEPLQKWLVGGTHRRVGLGTASARYGVTWKNAAGTATEVANVHTVVAGTSDTRAVAEWEVPSGAVLASWRAKAESVTGGAVLEIIDPVFERRTSNERTETDAVDTRTITATNPLDTKHTITGMLAQAASGSTGFKASPSGLFFYDGAGLAFDATSSGVYVRGSLEAGGILIENDVIDFGGSHTITYTGFALEINAALVDFSTNVAVSGGLQVTSTTTLNATTTINATTTMNGTLDHDGSLAGFFSVAPVGRQTIAAAGAPTLANTIRTALINLGLCI